jgi:hypothetical protein
MNLSSLTAAAVAAAIVTAIVVLAFSRMPDLLVWAAFIGWASYDHSGANAQALLRSSAGLVLGVVMAWTVALVVASGTLPLGVPLATAVSAAIASFVIVVASRVPLLSIVPAAFYGFASTFAYVSLAPDAFTISALTKLGGQNALAVVPLSLLMGTGLGVAHGWLAKLPVAGETGAEPRRAIRLDGSILAHGDGRKREQRIAG